MSTSDLILTIIVTAIFSPLICFVVYLSWKTSGEVRKTMRRNEVVEAIKNNWEVKKAITDLIIEKAKNDYLFQQAVVSIVKKERA
jgi:hypothetical protein